MRYIVSIIFVIAWAILLWLSVKESKREGESELSRSIFGSTKGKISWACLIAACLIFVLVK